MGFSHSVDLSGIRAWFSRRIPSLQKGSSGKLWNSISGQIWKNKKRILAGLFTFISIFLGKWAADLSEQDAILKWEKIHLPSQRLCRFALESLGFRSLTELKSLQKILKSLPSRLDDSGAIWVSSNLNWVVIYLKEDSVDPIVYLREGSRIPDAWKRAGVGWTGFESLLVELEQSQIPKKSVSPRKVKRLIRDSREILY